MTRYLDVDSLRKETPGCTCLEPRIHFNNAGAALPPQQVVDTIKQHLDLEANMGGYEAMKSAQAASEQVYQDIATLLNADDPSEIACVENATRAYDYAFHSLVLNGAISCKRNIVVTTASEYGSNHIALTQAAQRTQNHERVLVVSLTWIPTNGGVVHPAADVGALCRKYSVPYLLDACQAVGQIDVDVKALNCDALCATGRKYLRGPRGIGLLYVRKDSVFATIEPIFLDVHSARLQNDGSHFTVEKGPGRRFENWERPLALWLGLGAAVAYTLKLGIVNIEKRIRFLGALLRKRLADVPGVQVLDLGERGAQCGIVSFNVGGLSADDVNAALYQVGINTSVSKCTSTLNDMRLRGIDQLVRASVHYYNTEFEVERFINQIHRLA